MFSFTKSDKWRNNVKSKFFRLSKINKVYTVYILFLILFSCLSLLINRLSGAVFFMLSVLAISIVVQLYKAAFEFIGSGLKGLNKSYVLLILVSVSLVFLLFIYFLLTQKTIKVWDYSVYWFQALTLQKRFDNSFVSGIISVGASIYFSEYNRFLLMFTEVPFRILGDSITSFTLSYYFVGIIPIIAGFTVLAKEILKDAVNEDNNFFMLSIAATVLISFPLLYASALRGMPDVFGIVFITIILLSTYRHDFSQKEVKRLFVIGFSLVCLMLVRRWYVFWIVGYFASIIISETLCNLMSKNYIKLKKALLNIVIFGLVLLVAVVVVFFPLLFMQATANYAKHYKGYMGGGFPAEIINQIGKLGTGSLALIVCGSLFGLGNKNTRGFTIFSIINLIIPMWLFTRIQNMGDHQSLVLVPSYISLMLLAVALVYKAVKKWRYLAGGLIGIYCVVNMFVALDIVKAHQQFIPMFSNVSLKPEIRMDYEDIKLAVDYIDAISSMDNKVYIISGSGNYNVDVFRNSRLPDITFREKVYAETSVDLTHGFPIHLFEAKYVLVSDPLQYSMAVENSRVIQIIGESIMNNPLVSSHYKKIKEFKVGEGLNYHLFELIKPLDDEVAKYYLQQFEKYYSDFPDQFGNRIKTLMKNR